MHISTGLENCIFFIKKKVFFKRIVTNIHEHTHIHVVRMRVCIPKVHVCLPKYMYLYQNYMCLYQNYVCDYQIKINGNVRTFLNHIYPYLYIYIYIYTHTYIHTYACPAYIAKHITDAYTCMHTYVQYAMLNTSLIKLHHANIHNNKNIHTYICVRSLRCHQERLLTR